MTKKMRMLKLIFWVAALSR